jgi:threonine efflux protein
VALTATLGAVAGIWGLAVVTPGPNFLVTARVAGAGGRPAGFAAVAGIGIGTMLWGLSGFFGVQALFALAPFLWRALMLLGAGFLVLTGLRLLRGGSARPGPAQASGPALRLGLLTSLSNPKSALFVGSLFATLMPLGASVGTGLASVATMVAISLAWYGVVAGVLASRPAAALYRRCAAWIDRLAGAVFIGFGAKILLSRP